MGLRFPEQVHGQCFFVTTTFHEWRKYGDTPGVYEMIARSLKQCLAKYEGRLLGYVLMPSHLHMVLLIDGEKLSSLMRDFKKYVSQKGMKDLGITDFPVWQPRYDRVAVYSEDVLRQKLEYIHANPVRAGLVKGPVDWEWSSARDYAGAGEGVLAVWKDW